mgnify:CR=1 FL=1|tara:strand:- start:371 stop:916 length:546 start_codon:yes stop_codon:yes gene_type:complete
MPIKLNKLALVDSITIEEEFRDRINGTIKQLDNIAEQQRIMFMTKSLENVEYIGSISGRLTMWDDFEEKINKVEKQLDELRTKLKYSRWKEKLWRYAYNGDLPNVIKYHNKMEIYERKDMEELNELVNGEGENFNGIRVMEFHGNDEEEKEADNTGGYMMICAEYKRRYDIGKSIIKLLEE